MTWVDKVILWFAAAGGRPIEIASKRSLERVQNGLEPLDQDFLIMQGEPEDNNDALQKRT